MSHPSSPTNMTSRPLQQPGAILLISCYELGHQPIGLAQPVGFLEQKGYAPCTLDLSVEDFDAQRVHQARVVCISVPMHTALSLGCQVAERVRHTNANAHICFYGLYASLNAEYLLEHLADSVIGGEYETPLVSLLDQLANSQCSQHTPHDTVSGFVKQIEGVSCADSIVPPFLKRISWPANASITSTSDGAVFPIPTRTALPALSEYARLEYQGQEHVVGYVEASRGCLHTCLHCPIVPVYQGRFFLFPAPVVLADIRQQVKAGAVHITLGDPDFLNGPGHSLNIVRAMHEEFPHLTFDFTTKIEHILKHQSLFKEFSQLGCLFVISAVESFSETVLTHLDKGHTRQDIFIAHDILQSVGITLRPSLVAFTPWTSLEDYAEMFDLVERHGLIDCIDPVQYSVRLLVPPGSALLTPPETHPTPMAKFLGSLDQQKFQHTWTHPDPRMDALQKAVTKVVESSTKVKEDPERTFYRLWELVYDTAGLEFTLLNKTVSLNPNRVRPP
ncbi:MAG: CUAEP/CCAEP-tail radical SAM protein, partial [Nitrospirota bacterium]|nr:CUAEP/CCAEP-tail radical SAM protein [Nitrospirota bacterium]MDX2419723.1 CUAEP/CCAEP-tail radical SAM protein [Nitrospirota bacterium]